jgi:hypothetical protein
MVVKKPLDYTIVERIGVLSEVEPGKWGKEINIIQWDTEGKPMYDIRKWARKDWDKPDKFNDAMGKGISLTDDEAGMVLELLGKKF